MSSKTPPGVQSTGTTDTDAPTDYHLRCDRGCSPAFPAAACYIHERVRGLPAVVPVSRSASTVDWEARALDAAEEGER
jgi:hypothetical protein